MCLQAARMALLSAARISERQVRDIIENHQDLADGIAGAGILDDADSGFGMPPRGMSGRGVSVAAGAGAGLSGIGLSGIGLSGLGISGLSGLSGLGLGVSSRGMYGKAAAQGTTTAGAGAGASTRGLYAVVGQRQASIHAKSRIRDSADPNPIPDDEDEDYHVDEEHERQPPAKRPRAQGMIQGNLLES